MDRDTLESASREMLIAQATALGIDRPEVLTRVELTDEILRVHTPDPVERQRVRGWLGIARDLLASVVEQGLNLPEAAAVIRGAAVPESMRPPQPPIATVTLAQIYAAQGHLDRALATLDEVLQAEPEHPLAGRLREELRQAESAAGSPIAAASPPGPNDAPSPAPKATPSEAENQSAPRDDALVTVRLSEGDVYVYWELARDPVGEPVIRVLECRPGEERTERIEHRLSPTAAVGGRWLTRVAPDATVRAVLGVQEAGAYRALAVAIECRPMDGELVDVLFVPWKRADLLAVTHRAAEHAASASPPLRSD